jgi:hypothetical protein
MERQDAIKEDHIRLPDQRALPLEPAAQAREWCAGGAAAPRSWRTCPMGESSSQEAAPHPAPLPRGPATPPGAPGAGHKVVHGHLGRPPRLERLDARDDLVKGVRIWMVKVIAGDVLLLRRLQPAGRKCLMLPPYLLFYQLILSIAAGVAWGAAATPLLGICTVSMCWCCS